MSTKSFQAVPLFSNNPADHRRRIAEAVNGMMGGKINATASVTLNASATTTTITDARIGADTYIELSPLTASAATAKPSVYVSAQQTGQATLTHASNAAADQTFRALLIG